MPFSSEKQLHERVPKKGHMEKKKFTEMKIECHNFGNLICIPHRRLNTNKMSNIAPSQKKETK
jgi:hypothetical protein